MGGLTYLFGFVFNAFIAAVIAGVVGLVAASLSRRNPVEGTGFRTWSGARRGGVTFAVTWLSVMFFGCVQMFRTHHDDLSKFEDASVVLGLIDSEDQVIAGEHISHGDTAQTYVVVETTQDDVERFTAMKALKAGEFDAHTVSARGRTVPDWWPTDACPDGVTYNDDPWADPPTHSDIVLNWCPRFRRAYVQRFDY